MNDDGDTVVDYLCVVCAETVKGLPFVTEKDHVPGVEVAIRHRGPKHWGNVYAVISYGDIQFMASSRGTGSLIEFKEKNSQEPQFAKNVYQLWSKIKRQLHNPPDSKIEYTESLIRRRGKRGYDND